MLSTDLLISQLIRIAGEDGVTSATDALTEFAVDGVLPRAVVAPAEVEQVCEVLRFADAERLAVVPRGNGTKMHVGNPPQRVDVVLSTARLNRIIEHDADNLTVIAEAGVTLGTAQRPFPTSPSLQAALAAQGQRLPLDPPASERSTLGGIAATNAFGPRRLLYRAPRDLIVGLHAVLPNGDVVKAGGKVVKNVSGYDLNKLFVNSFGTIGVITQTTWRLYPLVAEERTLQASFDDVAQAAAVVAQVMDSYLLPTALVITNAPLPDAHGVKGERRKAEGEKSLVSPFALVFRPSLLLALFDGVPEGIERQMQQTTQWCEAQGAREIQTLTGETQAQCWRELRDFPLRFGRPDFRDAAPHYSLVCRAAVPLTQTGGFMRSAEEMASAHRLTAHVCAHAGVGIVYVHLISPTENEEGGFASLVTAAAALRETAERSDGYLVVEYAPTTLKRQIGVWGVPRRDASLLRRLKAAFDPHDIMSPARFVS